MMLFNDIRLDKSLHIENNAFNDLKILIDTTDSKIFETEFLSFYMIKNKLPLREKCPNTELSLVRIFIQSEYEKARTRKNSVFWHFSRRIGVKITDIFHICLISVISSSLITSSRSSHPELFLRTKQLYWNHTSAWVFSCKFAIYFQNTFS